MLNDEELDWSEYVLFAVLTIAFLSIVFYYSRRRSLNLEANSTAVGQMGLLPISLSLVASNISCITFGMSNEVYQYGITIAFEILGMVPIWLLTPLQMSVLYKLKLASLNEYLALRFDSKVKCCGALCILISMVSISTIINYVLSLFISHLSGLSMFKCFIAVIFPCYFLTAMGGFRGVISTDVLQAAAMFASILVLLGVGLYEVGGISNVYAAAQEGGRLDIEWSTDPTSRLNIMSGLFGLVPSTIVSYGLALPWNYQRYVALSTEKSAMRSVGLQLSGMVIVKVTVYALGLTMYALNQGCDPVRSGQVHKYDQMLAFYVNRIGSRAKFARGMYIVGFMSAGVSSLTSLMNTFSVILYKDFLQAAFNPKDDRAVGNWLTHMSGFLLAIFMVVIIIPLSNSGTVTELGSLMTAPMALYSSLFFTGLFLPWIGSKNMLLAYFVGILVAFCLTIGSRIAFVRHLIVYTTNEMRIDQCSMNISHNARTLLTLPPSNEQTFYLFRITPFYHSSIICFIVIAVAIALALANKDDNIGKVDERLIPSCLRRFIKRDVEIITPLRTLP